MITLYAVRDKNTGAMGQDLPRGLNKARNKKRIASADITRWCKFADYYGLTPTREDLEVVELKCYAVDEAVPGETTSLEHFRLEVKGVEDEFLRCRKCGNVVVWEYTFCPECGRKVEAE